MTKMLNLERETAPFRISVTRRRTSRMSMRIAKDGEVRVSVPYGTPDDEVKDFVCSHREWIEKARAKTTEGEQTRQAFFAQLPLKTRQDWDTARQRLDSIVLPMLEHHAREMGVEPAGVYYRATISRWGCCHPARRVICLSPYLLLLPEWCIEHIVVHELVHLLVPNHGPRFHALMDHYFPSWREARAETKKICRSPRGRVDAS